MLNPHFNPKFTTYGTGICHLSIISHMLPFKTILVHLLLLFSIPSLLPGQCGLQSGPMNGHSAMLEATIWVQTKCAQEVMIRYWEEGDTTTSKYTTPVLTQKENGYTAKLLADKVAPGKTYAYELYIDDAKVRIDHPLRFRTQPLWQWREDPPDFSFIAGSCAYVNEPEYDRPGEAYGGNYEIFTAIAREEAEFMVWLGDNTYLREVDWDSRTGIYHRYTHTRSLPEMQPLLGKMHHYAIWDDHDYGPNDSDRSYWGKELTREAFVDFWANPGVGVGGSEGITGFFQWNDCDFFLLDNRWYRGPIDSIEACFGDLQIQWLIDALRYSKAPYKFICTGGQILSDAAIFENYARFAEEKARLMAMLDRYDISGVVFLTGDRHHSEITKMVTDDGDLFYDITSSALTSKTYNHDNEQNTFRVPGSMIGERNYAVISLAGPYGQRICSVVFKDVTGKPILEYTLDH